MKQRLSGLPNVVQSPRLFQRWPLSRSHTCETNGIRVFDVASGYTDLPSDADYGDRSTWADFDAANRLVTASLDGFVRLYAVGHYDEPMFRRCSPGRVRTPSLPPSRPMASALRSGFIDTPNVVVLSGADLRQLYLPDLRGVPDVRGGLNLVAWARDGRQLFAGGKFGNKW